MWTTIYEGSKWKPCSNCEIEKPASDFCRQAITPKTRKDGLTSWCKLCYSQHFKKSEIQSKRLAKEKRYLQRPYVKLQRRKIYSRFDSKPTSRYDLLVSSAKKRNLQMDISFEAWRDLVLPNICHYCLGNLGHTGLSLDRKYNELGYTIENVVPCCGECNYMKRDMPYDEFVILSDGLREIKRLRAERAGTSQ